MIMGVRRQPAGRAGGGGTLLRCRSQWPDHQRFLLCRYLVTTLAVGPQLADIGLNTSEEAIARTVK